MAIVCNTRIFFGLNLLVGVSLRLVFICGWVMQAHPYRTIPVRCVLVLFASFSVSLCSEDALAVRPFVTDDARIIYIGQVVTESYGGMTMAREANRLSRRAHWKA